MVQTDMQRRMAATQATMAKFRDRPFSWADRATCIHMARFHMVQMGHKPPPLPQFRSALGAKRAMAERGWNGLADLFDAMGLLPVPAASLRLGDLATLPGDNGLDSVVVALGGGEFAGWREDVDGMTRTAGAVGMATGAWRL